MATIDSALGNERVYELARQQVGLRTVGLAVGNQGVGSATPVRFGEKFGLTTAGHIAKALNQHPKIKIFGLNDSERRQSTSFLFVHSDGMGHENESKEGPDIAYVPIDPLRQRPYRLPESSLSI